MPSPATSLTAAQPLACSPGHSEPRAREPTRKMLALLPTTPEPRPWTHAARRNLWSSPVRRHRPRLARGSRPATRVLDVVVVPKAFGERGGGGGGGYVASTRRKQGGRRVERGKSGYEGNINCQGKSEGRGKGVNPLQNDILTCREG